MAEYIVSGSLTFDGVEFIIDADSAKEALEKALRGQWAERILDSAEGNDWTIDSHTLRLNV